MKGKLKLLCEYGLSKQALDVILGQIADSDEVKSYYTTLGPDRLKSLSYSKTFIKKLGIVTFSKELLISEMLSNFNIGDKLSITQIKEKLKYIYSSINYTSVPKATDLEDYFTVKEAKINEILSDGSKKKS